MSSIGRWIRWSLALATLSAAAQAQTAYTAKDAHLRAGPSRDYPVVAVLPAGMEVAVQGCLNDYSWCDVIAGPSRGWLYAANISYAYQGSYVPILGYGADLGIAIVGFGLLDYWNSFYRDRPWYRDRDTWAHRPRPPRAAIPVRPSPGGPAGPGAGRPMPPRSAGPAGPRSAAPRAPMPAPGVAPPYRGNPVAPHAAPPQGNRGEREPRSPAPEGRGR